MLEVAWRSIRGLPLLVQLLLWLFALLVMLGLWVWQTAWPLWLRLLLVAGLASMTVYTFFPRLAAGRAAGRRAAGPSGGRRPMDLGDVLALASAPGAGGRPGLGDGVYLQPEEGLEQAGVIEGERMNIAVQGEFP